MKKKRIVLGVVGVLLALIIFGGLLVSMEVGRQVGEGVLRNNEANDTKGNSLAELAGWGYDLEAFQSEWPEEYITVTASDGTMVPVGVYRPETLEVKAAVILVHGHGGDRVSVAPLAEMYLRNGYAVYALDQRSSGDSENPLCSFGYFEKQDVAALVDYVKRQAPELPVVAHGQSMGAATSMQYAATPHGRANLDALVSDSSFAAMEPMVLYAMGMDGLIGWYFARCGDWYLKSEYGFVFGDVDVIEQAPEVLTPTLVIQCERDEIAPVEVGTAIYEALGSDVKKYWQVDSEHIEAAIDYPDEYEEQLKEFLEGVLLYQERRSG